ncbi:hypothetical protein [Leisingera sp. S232]|uniref:hypothetical protein n=1 Tax=Leisingera sp. S232 TaxID=3415132 RepID=UPI003C797FED
MLTFKSGVLSAYSDKAFGTDFDFRYVNTSAIPNIWEIGDSDGYVQYDSKNTLNIQSNHEFVGLVVPRIPTSNNPESDFIWIRKPAPEYKVTLFLVKGHNEPTFVYSCLSRDVSSQVADSRVIEVAGERHIPVEINLHSQTSQYIGLQGGSGETWLLRGSMAAFPIDDEDW